MVRHQRLRHLLVLHVLEERTAHIMAKQTPSLPPLVTTLHGQAQVKLQVSLGTTAQVVQTKQNLVYLVPTQTQAHLPVAQAALGTHTLGIMLRLTAKIASQGTNLGQDTPNAIYHLQASPPCNPVDNRLDSLQDNRQHNRQGNQLEGLLDSLRDNRQGNRQDYRQGSLAGNRQGNRQDNRQ